MAGSAAGNEHVDAHGDCKNQVGIPPDPAQAFVHQKFMAKKINCKCQQGIVGNVIDKRSRVADGGVFERRDDLKPDQVGTEFANCHCQQECRHVILTMFVAGNGQQNGQQQQELRHLFDDVQTPLDVFGPEQSHHMQSKESQTGERNLIVQNLIEFGSVVAGKKPEYDNRYGEDTSARGGQGEYESQCNEQELIDLLEGDSSNH